MIKRFGYSPEEIADRLNYAMFVQNAKVSDLVTIKLDINGTSHILKAQFEIRKVRESDIVDWSEGTSGFPYWCYIFLRAAMNKNFMRDYEPKKITRDYSTKL